MTVKYFVMPLIANGYKKKEQGRSSCVSWTSVRVGPVTLFIYDPISKTASKIKLNTSLLEKPWAFHLMADYI